MGTRKHVCRNEGRSIEKKTSDVTDEIIEIKSVITLRKDSVMYEQF